MKRALIPILATSLFFSSTAFGAASEEQIQELREQLAQLSRRLEELAAENADLRRAQDESANAIADVQSTVTEVAAATTPAGGESWSDRVRLDGDFRYRYERIDAEGSDTRKRNRIRARVNVKADLSDDVEVGFGLATGGDDPVSTNQTLGGGGSSKGVVLNLAYANWEATDGLHLIFGKLKNPLYRVGRRLDARRFCPDV